MAKAATSRMPTPDDRVIILHGPELFLRTEYTDHLRRLLHAAHGDCEFVKFEGLTANPAEVLDECRSFGLMATHKLVVVDDAELFLNAETRPMVERYCQAPSDQATLVLRAASWRPGNIDKLVEKVGAVIKCDSIDPAKAAGWVIRRAEKTHKARIEPAVAARLVERTGTDLGRLDGELAKLAAAAGPNAVITPELVTELVGLTREEDAWAIQSLLLCGDAPRAMRELRVILGNGSKDMTVVVSLACCELARKLLGVVEGMAQRRNPMQLAREVGLWGDAQDAVLLAARRISPAKARELFDAAVAVDEGIKSGLDAEIAVEVLALKFLRTA